MYEGCEDSSHSHGTVESGIFFERKAQSTSRPSTIDRLGSSPRLKINTFGGGCLAIFSASSTKDLYVTTLPMRLPPSAVTISAGLASSTRAARLAGANPPKTTECTAPRRAQARMANIAWGIIGM